jgi:NAD(P)H-flavin reductase
MPIQWFDGKITKITDLTSMTRSFTVEIIGVDTFDFLPGQFITMDLPIGDKRAQRWRSYSIASRPKGNNLIELCIVINPEGLGSKYLFSLTEGDTIKFKGPDGGFVVPSELDKEIVMVCTGTGVAPFKSMIEHIISRKLPFNHIHLIFGTRHEEDILYREYFETLAKENLHFKYNVALSRESTSTTHFGYVHDIYISTYEEKSDDRLFMLCGWSGMIDQALIHLLVESKYAPHQVKYELYG